MFTEKTHDVRAGKSGHGMVHPAWIEAPQVGRVAEDNIESPLVLVSRPVIRDGVFTEDLGMNGVELLGDAVEQFGPFSFDLTIHSALGFRPVGNPREAVISLQVIEAGSLHLSRQPFSPVEADLDGERKPCLNASVEEAEDRIDVVGIEE